MAEEPRSEVTGLRRLSQAIAEGDGISIIVHVADVTAAASAEAQGAEGLVLVQPLEGAREATSLPLLWWGPGRPHDALAAGADAWRLVVEYVDEDELGSTHAEAAELDLECVVDVRDEDELELALELLDPEILVLSGRDADDDEDPLDRVLALLPDVPAGKLAIADLPVRGRNDVVALERAGMDGVITSGVDVGDLVGEPAPAV